MLSKIHSFVYIGVFVPSLSVAQTTRPNFVFMVNEDISSYFLGLYNGGKGVNLSNVEKLASEGIVFNNMYCNAPVSSAARSTVITGCYGPRMAVSFHPRIEPVSIGQRMFPSYLREIGYFTANACIDYNCELDSTAWDVKNGKLGEWRNRPNKSQPFLYFHDNIRTHESSLHFTAKEMDEKKLLHSLSDVNLLPMHPDTKLFRYTYATFYDRIKEVDNELGTVMDMLREDGELDNTFVVFCGDHGGSLPGSKGYTYELGLKVPFVVYIPKNWRNKIKLPLNSRVNGIVSYMDIGPTILHLAGLDVPENMDGLPFMGENITLEDMNARDVAFSYADRFDELYAFNRVVRKGNLKYSRNFLPYHPKSLYTFYRYRQLAFLEWKELYEAGKLSDLQRRFFEPQGVEELYDLSNDPNETCNLAKLPAYRKELKMLRELLFSYMIEKNDLGLFPECVWLTEGKKNIVLYGIDNHSRIENALKIANLQLVPFSKGYKSVLKTLDSPDPVMRYWALTVCASWGEDAKVLSGKIREKLNEETEAFVRSRALVFLTMIGENESPVEDLKDVLSSSRSEAETLQILNDMAFLKEKYPQLEWNIRKSDMSVPTRDASWRIKYLNE